MKWSKAFDFQQQIQKEIQSLNAKTACFVAMETPKLPWGTNEKLRCCTEFKNRLLEELVKLVERGYDTFLCALGGGFDVVCAEAVIFLKKKYPHLRLIGAIAYTNHEKHWSVDLQMRYKKAYQWLDSVRCIYDECPMLAVWAIEERNKYMVNASSLLLTLDCPLSKNTRNQVKYAKAQGLEIICIKA